jgi:hypothetical protein
VPFFFRQSSCSQPSKLSASQPRPTALAMFSFVPPLNDAGAPDAGVGGAAGAGAASGAATLVTAAALAGATDAVLDAATPAGSGLLQPSDIPNINPSP